MIIAFSEALGWLLAAGLWWMFCSPYQKYQCDRARYRQFVIRDELFDIPAQGSHFKCDDRAYGMARTTLNGMLRTVEDFSMIRLLTQLWRASHDEQWRSLCAHYDQNFERATDDLSPHGRQSIHDAMGAAHSVMFNCLLRRSLTLLALRAIGRLLRPIRTWITRIRHSKQIRVAMSYESNIAGHDGIEYGLRLECGCC